MLELLTMALGVGVGGASYAVYRARTSVKIHTIIEKDFVRLLKQRNLYKEYVAGRLLCSISGVPITYGNLGAIELAPDSTRLVFISKDALGIAADTPVEQLSPLLETV